MVFIVKKVKNDRIYCFRDRKVARVCFLNILKSNKKLFRTFEILWKLSKRNFFRGKSRKNNQNKLLKENWWLWYKDQRIKL